MNDKLKALSRSRVGDVPSAARDSSTDRLRAGLLRGFPWLVLAGVLVMLLLLFGKHLLPAAMVEVETVVTLREADAADGSPSHAPVPAAADPHSGAVLFQASGWFEADPYPYRATALVSGVVETVHVLEGQQVKAGDPVATLVREDAQLRLLKAQAALQAARASLDAAVSGHELAHARVESMRQQIAVAKARRQELADYAARATDLGPDVLPRQDIVQAGLRLNTQEQTIAAMTAQLKERTIDTERLAGELQARRSFVEETEVRLTEAELEFERTVIRAPVDGIIQRLNAAPGQKKLLMADDRDSATVALLFQPEMLQARIDVPIAEAARLSVGQAVLLESEYLPGSELRGHVQRIVGEADLQRNTLQVKVGILGPPAGLRPEILCRAQFLDTQVAGISTQGNLAAVDRQAAAGTGRLRILVPRDALFDVARGKASVWALDQSGQRLELRALELAGEERDGFVLLRSGLRPGDRVVINPSADLRDGIRIRI